MSTDYITFATDEDGENYVSGCCGAPVYEDIERCSECSEVCIIITGEEYYE